MRAAAVTVNGETEKKLCTPISGLRRRSKIATCLASPAQLSLVQTHWTGLDCKLDWIELCWAGPGEQVATVE